MSGAPACPVVDRVGRTAARFPHHTAVVTATEQLDYAGLWRRVLLWRLRCANLGLPPGTLVAVHTSGAALPAAFLGVRAAGLVPVLLDATQPAARIASVVATARPAAVLRSDHAAELTGEPDPRRLPTAAGYVVFSSGTQGRPKGIVGQAAGLLHFIDWEIGELGITPGTRVAMLTSPSFDVVYRDLLLPLCAGGELHIAESGVRAAPAAVLPWLAEHDIEVLHAVPSLSARWLDGVAAPVNSLRYTLFAG
ncbi:MAG TPA: AMP-binding protein, partial [Pseudonocardiaceae bacterium]|nr:AMP-binding protein [Pseudonocardiaceae bacterium]